ncbi:DUF4476 domain-containing protein [uncultured Chitinophaga sp.]|uniref:DUF4476 domain-containing protein n=1 Tax=uncultured Chitinophaga sp. TaxID=339340 RepID=UPI0025D45ADC|nr:DUF4476 domain-containing protein [uncultured Chitinophaga sp.]
MHQIKKGIIYIACCLFMGSSAFAQEKTDYFVYIQNEKSQPFYLKYKGQVISSSPKGYIILSKMEQGESVPVTVGFPKNEHPEQSFLLKVNRRDQGLLLKNGEEGFALYDLQSFAVTRAGEGLVAKQKKTDDPVAAEVAAANTEAFKEVGTDVTKVGDVATNQPETPKKADAAPPKAKGNFASALDRVVVDGRDEVIPEEKPEMVAAPVKEEVIEPAAPTEKLSKKQQRKNRKKATSLSEEEQAILASVLDDERKAAEQEASDETAAQEKVKEEKGAEEEAVVKEEKPELVLPAEEVPVAKKEKKSKKKTSTKDPEFIEFGEESAAAVTTGAAVATEAAVEKKPSARDLKRQKRKEAREASESEAIDSAVQQTETPVEEIKEKPRKKQKVEEETPATGETAKMANSDCAKSLEVDEFRKLMRKMSGQKNEDNMIDVFRKGIKGVCVSTDQVRSLVQLLDQESYRYQLLDIAYPKTVDAENFSSLSSVLKQDYYVERFKAMLRKK